MMLTCDPSVVVGMIEDDQDQDQGFVMQQSIGNITTIYSCHRDKGICLN